ncbi:MAG: STAS domain-containing protein [Leptospiraceae bacterium]|jgi:anti-sigma B factor antagonist|nr:STAS domain-containing protein [Leptospiraceae bacterium]MCZ8345672.1 STAS domain-containing protein [Leptospiraceae bacterium]PJE00655.1 MAG: anti-anti-sigma factor [Leptospira sp.]
MAAANLSVKESNQGAITILSLNGELDAKTAPEFRAKLDSLASAGKVKIICDCKDLSYVASAGIGVMNAIQKTLVSHSGELILIAVKKEIRDTMDLMYFTKKVRLFGSIEEASAAFK